MLAPRLSLALMVLQAVGTLAVAGTAGWRALGNSRSAAHETSEASPSACPATVAAPAEPQEHPPAACECVCPAPPAQSCPGDDSTKGSAAGAEGPAPRGATDVGPRSSAARNAPSWEDDARPDPGPPPSVLHPRGSVQRSPRPSPHRPEPPDQPTRAGAPDSSRRPSANPRTSSSEVSQEHISRKAPPMKS